MTRRVLGAAAAAAFALTMSGCAFASPVSTQLEYAPSDGARVVLSQGGSEVRVENAMILTAGEGEPAQLFGMVANDSAEDATISIQIQDAVNEIDVPAGGTADLSTEVDPYDDVSVQPGATVEAEFTYDGVVTHHIPVLDGTLAPYDEYLP